MPCSRTIQLLSPGKVLITQWMTNCLRYLNNTLRSILLIIKNFSIESNLFATLRKDGGLALTIFGAKMMIKYTQFIENCIIAKDDVIPFISEGRSLFCKHVKWCGKNVNSGSDVVVIDSRREVLAVGKAVCGNKIMKKFDYGVAVKIREGIKSRNNQ